MDPSKRKDDQAADRREEATTDCVIPVVAKTDMGKPLFKASDGGQIDILREWEDITQSELYQGSGT